MRGGCRLSAPLQIRVERGQILRVSGQNGAGKSSLIYQLLGLNPSSAVLQFTLNGEPVSSTALLSERQLAAWLPQDSPLPVTNETQLKAFYERSISAPVEGLTQGLGVARLRSALDTNHGTSLETLSGGERQRWALYLTLMSGRPLVILDEPEAHLDHEGLTALAQYLSETRSCRACLLITHHPTLAALADQLLELERV